MSRFGKIRIGKDSRRWFFNALIDRLMEKLAARRERRGELDYNPELVRPKRDDQPPEEG